MKNNIFKKIALALTSFGIVASSHAVIISGDHITVDFDDFYAGTLMGYQNSHVDRQLYSSTNTYSPFAFGGGFDIIIDSNGSEDIGALYDSDTRIYCDVDGDIIRKYADLPPDAPQDPTATIYGRPEGFEGQGSNGEDPDLEYDSTGQWTQGNLEGERLGNVLIIQESFGKSGQGNKSAINAGHLYYTSGQSNSSRNKYAPDDNASGGSITFDFESNLNSFGFDFVDLDDGENASITFTDSFGTSTTISFDEFEIGGDFDQSSGPGAVDFGNGSANRIGNISVADVNSTLGTNLSNFQKVTISNSGSGGIATIKYSFSAIPEPSTVFASIGLASLVGFHFYRSRRKKANSDSRV